MSKTNYEVWHTDFMKAHALIEPHVKWNADGSGYVADTCPGPHSGFYWALVKIGFARGYFDAV